MKQTSAMNHPLAVEEQRTSKQKSTLQAFWGRYFDFYDTLNEAAPYQQMVTLHANNLEATADDLILDAGTGTGNVAVILLAQGAQVIGIDFCKEALERCRQKDPRGDFRFSDLTQKLEFESDYFDKVSCCNVFQFLNPDVHRSVLAELFRVLKPGGLFAITVFATGFKSHKVYRETLRAEREQNGLTGTLRFGVRYSVATLRILYYVWRIKRRQASGDYYFFDAQKLTQLLEDTGFEVLKLERVFASQCITAVAIKPPAGSPSNGVRSDDRSS